MAMKFGAHMSMAGGHHLAVRASSRIGFDTVQVFTKSNNQWKAKPLTDAEVSAFRDALRETGVADPVGHNSYLINMASPDDALRQKSIDAMVVEIERGEALGLTDLVAHPGAHVGSGEDEGLARIAESLDEIHRRTRGAALRIALETTAGQGSNLGHRFEHLGTILGRVAEPERLGVCVDTCHIFAAGYPLETPVQYNETIAELDRHIGIGRVRVWHLNDSMRGLGSRVDRHAGLGRGAIGLAAFGHVVNDPRFAGVPMILETPKGVEGDEDLDAINLRALQGLLRERRDAPLIRSDSADGGRAGPPATRTIMDSSPSNGSTASTLGATHSHEVAPDPGHYINRELSWLAFDERVLEEARDPSNPLLERLKFLAISASNLDEFFEVRVAGLQAQLYDNLEPQDTPPDGMEAAPLLVEISRRTHDFVDRQYAVWKTELRPALAKLGIVVCRANELTEAEVSFLDGYYEAQVYPVLTPLAVDPAHPFPHLHNKSLNLILRIETIGQDPARQLYAVLQVPSVLNRLVKLPDPGDGSHRFVLLEDVIGPRLDSLFGGYRVAAWVAFRVTRNSDLSIQENEVKISLLSTIQETLRQRKWGAAVRLEIVDTVDDGFLAQLRTPSALDLEERDVYKVHGPVDLTALMSLSRVEGFREFKDPPFEPQMPAPFANRANVFTAIRNQDLLVHHPYESFGSVVQFIEQAAEDPNVLAIKQTLYRTADDNPIITALARAAENGKQVMALVELQARLDEENNIVKARALQKAGVHVVYGMVGLKTHCKIALVVRREFDGIRRYVHLATGNYNPTTARLYTDLCLFTSKAEFGEDASALFNLLTGYSHGHEWKKLIIAPRNLADRIIALIHRERENAAAGRPARIIAKMNALVDPAAIEALYAASRAGVKIDLIIRGICCLRPGVPGLSENIRVLSIIDKFLEHSRISYFQNDDDPEVYLSSADWMPRNFRRRVEIMFPLEDPRLKNHLIEGILGVTLSDNVKARDLQPDGTYIQRHPGPHEQAIRSQVEFQNMAKEFSGHESVIVGK